MQNNKFLSNFANYLYRQLYRQNKKIEKTTHLHKKNTKKTTCLYTQ